jgi:hypothetical protein
MSDRVKFNVGGQIFETTRSTLLKYPDSVLATHIAPPWQPDAEGIYFFDRDPNVFTALLGFYRSNILERPPNISFTLWKAELDYWGITVPSEKKVSTNWPYKSDFIEPWRILGNHPQANLIRRAVDLAKQEQLNYIMFPIQSVKLMAGQFLALLSETEVQNEIKVICEAIKFHLESRLIEVLEINVKDYQLIAPHLLKVNIWNKLSSHKPYNETMYLKDGHRYVRAVVCHFTDQPSDEGISQN